MRAKRGNLFRLLRRLTPRNDNYMHYTNSAHFKTETGHEINGIWYPRVTRILEVKSKPALQDFFREVGSFENAENIKNKSAAEGTILHQTIQDFLTGKLTNIPESIRPSVEEFDKFNKEKKIILHTDFVEKPIWSIRHRYSGTVDALATIDGKFGVLDIKTSNFGLCFGFARI